MSDRYAVDMTQPFRFLDLPIDIRFMVYERLPISSRIVTLTESSLEVSLTSQGPLPPIHQTCKMLRTEATPFIQCFRRLLLPPRAVFEVSDSKELEPLYHLSDTLVSAQRAVRQDLPRRISTADCHEAVYAALDEWVYWAEGAAHEWVQRNVGALVEWTMSFHDYFMYSQTSSRLILEIALSGSSSISDEDLRDFVYDVQFELLAEKWVHVYEVPSVPETVRGKIGRYRVGRCELQDLYKGIIDKQTWEREWT